MDQLGWRNDAVIDYDISCWNCNAQPGGPGLWTGGGGGRIAGPHGGNEVCACSRILRDERNRRHRRQRVAAPDTSRYAEQLWLYDRPAVAAVGNRPAGTGAGLAGLPRSGRAAGHRGRPHPRPACPLAGHEPRGVSPRAVCSCRRSATTPRASASTLLLLHAIAHVEFARHNLDIAGLARRCASGLMKVMPATARRFEVTSPKMQLHDPEDQPRGQFGLHSRRCVQRFDNNLTLVIAAFSTAGRCCREVRPPGAAVRGRRRATCDDAMAHYSALLSSR